MISVPDPNGNNQLAWAIAVKRALVALDRRVSAILPQRPRAVEETMGREAYKPFQLVKAMTSGESPAPRIRVVASTVGGFEPSGFTPGDNPPYLLTPSGTGGYVWAGINLSQDTGELSDPWIDLGTSVPVDTDTEFYCLIGSYAMADGQISALSNLRYGPITAEKCRLWWAGASPYYGLSFA